MSERDDMHQSECGMDAAAYVLGALEPEEAEAFRAHLRSCVVCRDEVSAFGAVVDILPLGAPPQPAPRAVKRRVMAEVRAAGRAAERRSRVRRQVRNGGALVPRSFLVAASGAVVAAAVVLAIVLGGTGSSPRVIQASTSWQSARVVLRVSGGHGELIVQGMPAPPSGKVYEVWVKRAARPPAPTNALFSVTSRGSAAVDVPGNLRGIAQVMVTPEPAGGSRVPTHASVIVANLA